MKRCLDCKHWSETVPLPDEPPGERFGNCDYPVRPLPYAWRYARREVMSTYGDEGVDCQAFEPFLKACGLED